MKHQCWIVGGLLARMVLSNAAEPQTIVLRPDLPAGEEWYTPPDDNPHR